MLKNVIHSLLLVNMLFIGKTFAVSFEDTIINLPQPVFSGIQSVQISSRFFGYQSAVDRDTTEGVVAPDFGVNLLRIQDDGYRLYRGGRWKDSSRSPAWDGMHILLRKATNPLDTNTGWDAETSPVFELGREEGETNVWYSGETLHPQVLVVDGTWYLFCQVRIPAGSPIDTYNSDGTGKTAVTDADRIMLLTSTNGKDWTRKTNRGVVANFDFPTKTKLMYPEVLYVPWDPQNDGKMWWLYFAASENGESMKQYRIRSKSPTTFNWAGCEEVDLHGVGNQMAYIKNAPGGPLFLHITNTTGTQIENSGRKVPSLCFSRDGLVWHWGNGGRPCQLPGREDATNKDCVHLGISTTNGQGQLGTSGFADYRAFYAASTSKSSSEADLSGNSEIGYGDLMIDLIPTANVRWYVKAGSSGMGTSWDDAFGSISDALDAAVDGNEIWVAKGTYKESLEMSKRVRLLGGFAGSETSRDQSSWGANPTCIVGPSSADNVISVSAEGTTISGFQISAVEDFEGNGVSYDNVYSATFSSCSIVGNIWDGVYCNESTITLKDCYLAGLQTYGVSGYYSDLTLSEVKIFDNRYSGIYSEDSTIKIIRSRITDNGDDGITIYNCPTTLENCTIVNNMNSGISGCNSSTIITNCILGNHKQELVPEEGDDGEDDDEEGDDENEEAVVFFDSILPVVTYSCIKGGCRGDGNIDTDPQFVNPGQGDYQLKDLSPCINAGINTGSQVFNGSAPDMGFHESPASYTQGHPRNPITWYVNSIISTGGDGFSWATAMKNINSVLHQWTIPGDQIWVAGGTYNEGVVIPSGVSLYGGFAGSETNLNERNWQVNKTIIDATNTESYTAIDVDGTDGITIDGFEITHGVVFFENVSSATLSHCSIYNNEIDGVYSHNASLTMTHCTVSGNESYGVWLLDSTSVITNSVFWGNGEDISLENTHMELTYSCLRGEYDGEGNILANPLFMDPSSTDFSLQNYSPCIDAGIDLGQPFNGNAPDMGAYETPVGSTPGKPREATVIYVNANALEEGDGTSWASPLKTLSSALYTAFIPGDEIWVAQGTYNEAIEMNERVSLYGGFLGYETSKDQRNWIANPTIIDSSGISCEAVFVWGEGTSIDGFTILEGRVDYFVVVSGSLTNCTISDSEDMGVNCYFSSPHLSNCMIRNNLWNGVNIVGGSVFLSNCIIADNSSEFEGVAIYCEYAQTTLTNCTIVNNTAEYEGAIYSASSELTLTNCILWNPGEEFLVEGTQPVISYSDIEGGYPGTGNINTDPLFVNALNGDYHLQESSPCIDKGSGPDLNSLVPLADIDGEARIGSTCDIGVDEHPVTTVIQDWANY